MFNFIFRKLQRPFWKIFYSPELTYHRGYLKIRCSFCCSDFYPRRIYFYIEDWNYCPKCGNKMKGYVDHEGNHKKV